MILRIDCVHIFISSPVRKRHGHYLTIVGILSRNLISMNYFIFIADNEDEVIVYSKGADSSMIGKAGKRVKRESESALKSIEEDEEDNVDDDKPMKVSQSIYSYRLLNMFSPLVKRY